MNGIDNPPRPGLVGLSVLVVEDDFLLAQSLGIVLRHSGARVVGPVATCEEASALLDRNIVDVALLDVALRYGTSEAIAHRLVSRGCPVLFLSGYDARDVLPVSLRDRPCLRKPVDPSELFEALGRVSRPGSS